MTVQHLELVGFWHQAQSYVRGNWRRSGLAASMLLAKCCHDLDWLACILGRVPLRVSSFGSLTYFTAADRPAGAADRCVACQVEANCPYSAPRLYRGLLEPGEYGWPLSVVVDDFSANSLDEALRDGPYGRVRSMPATTTWSIIRSWRWSFPAAAQEPVQRSDDGEARL